ncbi:septal ring lytic transglycosylase RlpA family protein [Aliifodinibius sp. 1BSP15-2V2]|uniref:Probable endolytic peptidoglycan transglycosylase RlpA n=1 Tax=Fodinibius salsisoli TaxID=2820877 RepID=A0ABT3PPV7_9BACT|nr:septal ring lytic transglycosylase RlpA family protein [Fodinibius salsisoli]
MLVAIAIFISSCGTLSRTQEDSPKAPPNIDFPDASKSGTKIEEGIASWYGPKFNGKLTANGEEYDMHQFTAAHRTLPFNSIIKVRNLDNGEDVLVRINDRGPFAKNRIIDLSKKAAQEINMIGTGTARVALMIMGHDLQSSRTDNLKVPTYTVQLASFQKRSKAFQHSRKVQGARVETVTLGDKKLYRVYYGTFVDKNKARQKAQELNNRGFNGYVKQIQN